MTISRKILLKMWNIFDKICRENQNTLFCSITFLFENRTVYEVISKIWWSQSGYGWRHNMAQTNCMMDTQGYMHAPARICPRTRTHASVRTQMCNTYCFCTAIMITETRLNVTLHVHCQSCICAPFKILSLFCPCVESNCYILGT